MGYRVTAPYVTVQVNAEGGSTVLGYYAGAVLPAYVDRDSAEIQVRKGMVERFDDAEVPEQAAASDGEQAGGEGDAPPATPVRPAANGSKADWLAYALSQRGEGVSEDDARAELEPLTKAELIARFPG